MVGTEVLPPVICRFIAFVACQEETVDGVDQPGWKIYVASGVTFGKRIVRKLLVRRRFHEFDQVPVSVHFVGKHHGERSVHALTHIGMRDDGRHPVIRCNLDPDIEQCFIIAGDQSGDLA